MTNLLVLVGLAERRHAGHPDAVQACGMHVYASAGCSDNPAGMDRFWAVTTTYTL